MRLTLLASSTLILSLCACGKDNPPMDPAQPGSGGADTQGGTGGASSGGGSGGVNDGSGGNANSGGAPPDGAGGEAQASGGAIEGSGGAPQGNGFCPTGSDTGTPMLQGKTLTPITGVPEIVNNGGFLEGPLWFEGKLYLSQIDFSNSGDILIYTPGGSFTKFIEDQGTNGLAIDSMGRLIATSISSPGVFAYQMDNPTAARTDIATMVDGKTFNSPNDLAVRSDGTVYFTDPTHNCGSTCGQPDLRGVYRVPPGGSPQLLTTTQDQPNGIALSPDEKTLYVGGTTLTAHPVMADGSVGAGTAFGGVTGTDGLTVDCAGNVYVALHSAGMVVALDKEGTQLPGSFTVAQVTNLAFGGADQKTLFVTSFGDNRGQLYSVDLEVAGVPY